MKLVYAANKCDTVALFACYRWNLSRNNKKQKNITNKENVENFYVNSFSVLYIYLFQRKICSFNFRRRAIHQCILLATFFNSHVTFQLSHNTYRLTRFGYDRSCKENNSNNGVYCCVSSIRTYYSYCTK